MKAIAVVIAIIVGLLFIGLFAALGAVITWAAWNWGVVAIVAAAGGSIAKIGLVTAFFINVALGIVTSPFRARLASNAS